MKQCMGFIFLLAVIAAMTACSSAPASTGAVFERRNEAAQVLKTGDGLFKAGNYEAALIQYQNALTKNTAIDFEEGIIASKNSIGKIHIALREFDSALLSFGEAQSRAQEANLGELVAQSKALTAQVYLRTSRIDEAMSLLAEAEIQAGKDKKTLALVYHTSGEAYKIKGMYKKAEEYLLSASKMNSELKDIAELASDFYLLAAVEVALEQWAPAFSYAQKALENDKAAENTAGIASDYYALGRISRRMGKTQEALVFLKKSFETGLASDRVYDVRKALEELADLNKELGNGAEEAKYRALLKKIM